MIFIRKGFELKIHIAKPSSEVNLKSLICSLVILLSSKRMYIILGFLGILVWNIKMQKRNLTKPKFMIAMENIKTERITIIKPLEQILSILPFIQAKKLGSLKKISGR